MKQNKNNNGNGKTYKTITISRTAEKHILDIKAGGAFLNGEYFALSDFAEYADLSLFDQYRIKKIHVTLSPSSNVSLPKGVLGVDTNFLPFLSTCIDLDDASNPGSLADVLAHQTCITHGIFDKVVRRSFKPQVSLSAYQGAFTGYAQMSDQWLDTASSGIQHYGFKWAIEAAPVSTSPNYVILYARAEIELRYSI